VPWLHVYSTHVSVAGQLPAVMHVVVVVTLQWPSQFWSLVQKLPVSGPLLHVPSQLALVKHGWFVVLHVPGKQSLDSHEVLLVHGSPPASSVWHVPVPVWMSQNSPFMHCAVDVHAPFAPCNGLHVRVAVVVSQ
jgi:hypothetical protein